MIETLKNIANSGGIVDIAATRDGLVVKLQHRIGGHDFKAADIILWERFHTATADSRCNLAELIESTVEDLWSATFQKAAMYIAPVKKARKANIPSALRRLDGRGVDRNARLGVTRGVPT